VNQSPVSSHHHDHRIRSLRRMAMISLQLRPLHEHLFPLVVAWDRQGDGPGFFAAFLPRVQPTVNEMSSLSRSTRNRGVTNATFHIMLRSLAMGWTSGFDGGSRREFALDIVLDGE